MQTVTIEESKQIAATILEQLGGRRFQVMTGSKNFFCDGPTLFFTLAKNNSGANKLRITLGDDDLYIMVFSYVTAAKTVVKAEYSGVYFDMLQDIFTEVTGLYTHL